MAIQPSPVYHKMQQVFLLHEHGQLKGEKLREMKGSAINKGMDGKFSAKLTDFKIFQGLQVRRVNKSKYNYIYTFQNEDKESLLDDILSKKLSFPSAEQKSKDLKNWISAKDAFTREVDASSWEEAESLLEECGGKEQLKKFKVAKGKALPKDFEVS